MSLQLDPGIIEAMKFLAAMAAFVLMALVLGFGLGLAAYGHGVWLLVLGLIGFFVMFIRYGCLQH